MQGAVPQYIYSFNLTGTPAQIAASEQVMYTLPVPQADLNANIYPAISGIALDPVNHYLYFNQFDSVTGTNSFVGRLALTSSSESELYSANNGNPTLQVLYAGRIPGIGPIAIDSTNLYLGAYNLLNGTNGVYAAPLSGGGSFSELVVISAGDTTFSNGIIGGVASYPKSNLVYYVTSNGGTVNHNYPLSENAIWMYNTTNHLSTLVASGYSGYPNNIALDPANLRYYFTVGADGTGNFSPTNHQAIYAGALGSPNPPTIFFTPSLSGQDVAGGANAGQVSLQGIFVQDIAGSYLAPTAVIQTVAAEKNTTLELPAAVLIARDIDPNGGDLGVVAVNAASTNGGSVSLSGNYVLYTPVSSFTGSDQFTYTFADSEGGQAQGTVNVNVQSFSLPPSNHLSMATAPNQYFLLYSGASNVPYVFQYANSLPGPWINLSSTLTAGSSGVVEFDDVAMPGAKIRFYRVLIQ
jgi:Big-like domain-containing protein